MAFSYKKVRRGFGYEAEGTEVSDSPDTNENGYGNDEDSYGWRDFTDDVSQEGWGEDAPGWGEDVEVRDIWTEEEQAPPGYYRDFSPPDTTFDILTASYTPQLTFTKKDEEDAVNQLLKDGYYLAPGDALYERALEMWAAEIPSQTTNTILTGLMKYGMPILRAGLSVTPLGMFAKTGIGLALTVGQMAFSTPKQAVNKVSVDKVSKSTGIPTTTVERNINQNMDIIGAKLDYREAEGKGDTRGMQVAASKATSARQAGGSISASTPLDQNLIDAYDMWSQVNKPQLASSMSGEIFGIPTWIIFAGLGIGLVFGSKRSKSHGKRI